MRFLIATSCLGLIAVLVLAALSAPAAAQAPVPTLQVGHAVGYGVNLDLTAFAAPILDGIRESQSMYNITSIRELNFTGSFDAWVRQEVRSKTDDHYVIAVRSAEGLKAHAVANVTFDNLPAPGTYQGTNGLYGCLPPIDVHRTTRSVEVRLDLAALLTSEGTSRWTVSEYALLQSTDNMTSQIRGAFSGRGIPRVDFNVTTCTQTIGYEDMDLGITADTTTQIRQGFAPALDVYDFPIAGGETWGANATETIGATLSGTIDVRGASAEDERAFFENLTLALRSVPGLAVSGLDAFPINLAEIQITMAGVPILDNGVLRDQTQDVSLLLRAREEMMTLGDGQLHTVYKLTEYYDPSYGYCPPTLAAIYSPDDGLIVGLQILTCVGGTEVPVFEMRPVPADQAEDNIASTEENYVARAGPAGNPIADFFLAPPFLGVLLAGAAVLVVALVLIRRRRKPTPAAPPIAEAPPSPPGTP